MTELLLTYDYPPMGGGIARWMAELATRWPGGSLVVSTGTVPGAAEADAAMARPPERLPIASRRLRTLQGLLLWSRRVTVLTRDRQVRFLWCGNIRPAAYPAKWARERTGVPYGILLHGGDLLVLQHKIHQSRVKRGMIRSLLGSAAVLVANSRWTADLAHVVLGELGLDAGDRFVRTVPLGTDPERFRPGLATDEVRRRYGLPADGRWLVTVARLVPHKGVDTALHAFAALAGEAPDLRYAVVGSGEHYAALRALAESLGVADRVFFLTAVPDEDLPALYGLATVYVGASRQAGLHVEGFGISLLEASASGVPVVAGRSGGIPDAVRDGETGLLVDAEDHGALAQAIRRLLGDAGLRERLGEGGRTAVETWYNWDRVARDLHAITAERAAPAPASRPPR